ncbi:MAG: MipA/OmpV family protein [Hyphomonadaceae bacterium]|nr:MipA/OmpV family protein [Hyphomonadaceae bacterium]
MKPAILAVLATLAVAPNAAAQEAADDGWRVTIGAGALYAPSYEGDDDYRFSALPSIEVEYDDVFFASVQNGVGYRIINTPTLRAGPIARLKFSRDEDGSQTFAVSGEDTDDLRGLGDVDASFELGGFMEFELGPVTLGAEARQAVSGHDGFVADLSAELSNRSVVLGQNVMFSIGPRARLVSDAYSETYFGVNSAQSAASGLPVYEAGGGLHSYGIGASVIAPLSQDRRWALVGIAGLDRLSGDAGESPLVQQRGAEEQFTLGLLLSRRL